MFSPEYDAKYKEVTAEIVARVQAHQAKTAMMQRPVEMLDSQIEAWKKSPKEQAMKELIELQRSSRDPPEKRIELEIIKAKSEMMGALMPSIPTSMHVVAIEVITPGQAQKCEVIDVTNATKVIRE